MESLFRAYSVDIYQWWNVSFLCKLKDVPPDAYSICFTLKKEMTKFKIVHQNTAVARKIFVKLKRKYFCFSTKHFCCETTNTIILFLKQKKLFML